MFLSKRLWLGVLALTLHMGIGVSLASDEKEPLIINNPPVNIPAYKYSQQKGEDKKISVSFNQILENIHDIKTWSNDRKSYHASPSNTQLSSLEEAEAVTTKIVDLLWLITLELPENDVKELLKPKSATRIFGINQSTLGFYKDKRETRKIQSLYDDDKFDTHLSDIQVFLKAVDFNFDKPLVFPFDIDTARERSKILDKNGRDPFFMLEVLGLKDEAYKDDVDFARTQVKEAISERIRNEISKTNPIFKNVIEFIGENNLKCIVLGSNLKPLTLEEAQKSLALLNQFLNEGKSILERGQKACQKSTFKPRQELDSANVSNEQKVYAMIPLIVELISKKGPIDPKQHPIAGTMIPLLKATHRLTESVSLYTEFKKNPNQIKTLEYIDYLKVYPYVTDSLVFKGNTFTFESRLRILDQLLKTLEALEKNK